MLVYFCGEAGTYLI